MLNKQPAVGIDQNEEKNQVKLFYISVQHSDPNNNREPLMILKSINDRLVKSKHAIRINPNRYNRNFIDDDHELDILAKATQRINKAARDDKNDDLENLDSIKVKFS